MPKTIYLDQNKWIQLSKVLHGKEKNIAVIQQTEKLVSLAKREDILMPLSATHFLETARIAGGGKRERLGSVMWEYSGGQLLASQHAIIINELRKALTQIVPELQQLDMPKFQLIGRGLEHVFGLNFADNIPSCMEDNFEKSVLMGVGPGRVLMEAFSNRTHQTRFQNHLRQIPGIENELPNSNWEDFLKAISITDILEPLNVVFQELGLEPTRFSSREFLEDLIERMPTRRLDIHLHTQVFKNKQYRPKLTDLEDWTGLGVASMYCDYVVCEKHFADLVNRNQFQTRAKVTSNFDFDCN